MTDSRDIPATQRFAWILGLAGLLPFVSHTLFVWLVPPSEMVGVLRSQAHYSAAILTFLGALHWGVTIASPSIQGSAAAWRMVWSVVPSLWCWIVTLYPVDTSLPMLFAGLAVALAVDWAFYRDTPVPRWFLTLRTVLSVGALASVGASWLAMSVRLAAAAR
ncbi:MAG: DUF3429 domain-containing protein [Burkholderiales bacterium]|jgi:hypothetical protein